MDTVTKGTGSRRAWTSRTFRWVWTGSAVSMFGSEIAELALPLLALVTLSATAGEVATLRAAQFLPFLLATLPLGLLVDRRRRLPLMIGADLGRFVLIGAIPLSVWIGLGHIEVLYVTVFAAGVLTALYQIADFSFMPTVVRTEQLPDANAKIVATQSAMEIGGRGLGGLLVQALTAPVAVAVNAVTYLLSAVSLSRIRIDEPAPQRVGGRSPLREVVDGLSYAVRNSYLRALLGEATTFNLFNEAFMLGLMIYAVRDLGISPAGLGLVLTAGGLGSFLGAWFGTRMTGRWGYGRVLLVTLFAGNTVPVAAIGAGAVGGWAQPLLTGVFLVMGVGIGVANSHAVTVRQVAAPFELRGRVNAAYRLISWGMIPLGAVGGGVLATAAGPWSAMLAGSVGVAAASLWVAFSPVPRLRRAEDAVPQPSDTRSRSGAESSSL
jgi:MFS family permease